MGIAIIDLDSIIFTAFHPNKVLDEDGQPVKVEGKFVYQDKTEDEITKSVDSLMNSILTKSQADGYIAFVKGKGNYRYKINPDYKANRPKESPKFWKFTKQYLIDNWSAIEVNDIEVDDAVNIARLQIPNSFICAIDKDLLYLEGTSYNWSRNKWQTIDSSESMYKFWADMIIGQPGDNIKGLPGKGAKYVEKLFESELGVPLQALILNEYINHLGEAEGIEEYYKNYFSLKILDNYKDFVIPEVVKYEQIVNNSEVDE